MNHFDATLVGKRIKQARKAKGYTQEELAEIIYMNPNSLSRLENATMGLSLSTLVALCRTLEVSADYLLFGAESGTEQSSVSHLLASLTPKEQIQAETILKAYVDACKAK